MSLHTIYMQRTKDQLVEQLIKTENSLALERAARSVAEGEVMLLRGQMGLSLKADQKPNVFELRKPRDPNKPVYGIIWVHDPSKLADTKLWAVEVSKMHGYIRIFVKFGKDTTPIQAVAS